MSNPFLGDIRMFGGNFAPQDWAFCNGQLLSINDYQGLYSLIGTTYGGDGVNTFALPDLQGRLPLGQGNGPGLTPRTIGDVGGAEQVTLSANQIPLHTHLIAADHGAPANPTRTPAANTYLASTLRNAAPIYSSGSANVTMGAAVGSTGSGIPVGNTPPVLCVNFIIALVGIFPSRN